MIQEYLGSVTAQLRHRIASPLIGAYVLSWFLINYQVPILMFSELEVERKLELLAIILKPVNLAGVWACYGLPLLFSLMFLCIYPLLSRPIYWWWHWQQNLLIQTRKRIEDERPLTRAEEQSIRKELWAQASKHAQELRERDERIKDLETRLDLSAEDSGEERAGPSEEDVNPNGAKLANQLVIDSVLSSLTDDQSDLLRKLYDASGSIVLARAFESGRPSVELSHAAQVLQEMGLVHIGPSSWRLTARGNAVVVHAVKSLWS